MQTTHGGVNVDIREIINLGKRNGYETSLKFGDNIKLIATKKDKHYIFSKPWVYGDNVCDTLQLIYNEFRWFIERSHNDKGYR